jgi:phage head maturation protease
MRFYWPIAKLDHERRMVWGYASTEAEDDRGEIIRRDALESALADYMRFANIREMHQPSAVGIAEEAAIDDRGLYLGARIVDGEAWEKVVAGVYKGFSIGGHVTARDPADRKIIIGLSLTEISVVDRPANPEAVFDCWKRAAAADDTSLVHPIVGRTKSAEPGIDVEYADSGYQQDGKQRYPIDTETHIRAAWAYIHQPANALHYTAHQLADIKTRVAAAWRDKIDPAGPPAANGEPAIRTAGVSPAPSKLERNPLRSEHNPSWRRSWRIRWVGTDRGAFRCAARERRSSAPGLCADEL